MFKKFLIATGGAAALYGIVAGTSMESSKIACDVDGDGTFYIQSVDGKLNKSSAWSLSSDGTQCVTGGGSSEPMILPRKDLVDSFGNALNQADPIGLFIEHYSEKAMEQGQKIRLQLQ